MNGPVNICGYCAGHYSSSTCPCPAAKRVSQSRRAELDHAHQQERWLAVTKTDWPFGVKAVAKKGLGL